MRTSCITVSIGVLAAAWVGATAPAMASPQGPVLSGTYDVTATYGTAAVNEVLHIASRCPRCDATATSRTGNAVTLTWNGAGWQGVTPGGCGPMMSVITPVGDPDGFVRNFTTVATFLTPEVCSIAGPAAGAGTRISD